MIWAILFGVVVVLALLLLEHRVAALSKKMDLSNELQGRILAALESIQNDLRISADAIEKNTRAK